VRVVRPTNDPLGRQSLLQSVETLCFVIAQYLIQPRYGIASEQLQFVRKLVGCTPLLIPLGIRSERPESVEQSPNA
jgi:hypothetical protein